jgi:hypothetical protein
VNRLDTSGREAWLRDALAQLDDDLKGSLFQEAAIPSDPMDRRRIRTRTFERLNLGVPKRRTWRWAAGATGVALIVSATLPGSVFARLGKVFHFVPGLAVVQQTAQRSPVAILMHPASGTWRGRTIAITGMLITADRATAVVTGFPVHAPATLSFQSRSGHAITLLSQEGIAGNVTTVYYSASGKFRAVLKHPSGSLALGNNTRIPLHLTVSRGIREISKLAPTATRHNISLTAVAARSGAAVDVTVVSQSRGSFKIAQSVPPVLPASETPNVRIADAAGHHYLATPIVGFSANSQIQFVPKAKLNRFTVTVPEVSARYPGQTTVLVPIPAHGREKVDRTIQLAGFPVTITYVQRIHTGGFGLRVYFNLHPNASAARELYGFQWTNPKSGHAAQENLKTGVLEWVEEGITPGQHWTTLTLSQAHVYVWPVDLSHSRPARRPAATLSARPPRVLSPCQSSGANSPRAPENKVKAGEAARRAP